MIRSLRAFAWLRWRLLANGVRGGRRRDAMERVSRVAALVVPIALTLLFASSSLSLGMLGLAGGWTVASGGVEPGLAMFVVRLLLLFALLLLVVFSLTGAAQGTISGATRLRLLPIGRRTLHAVEVLACLADPWIAFILPGLVLFACGLLFGGRAAAAAVALAATAAITLLLASLGSLISFLMAWLLRSRRRSEMFTLVFVVVLSMAAVVPALLSDSWEQELRDDKRAGGPAFSVERLDAALPAWSRALPGELYARSILLDLEGRRGAAWLVVLALLLQAAALYALSSAAHHRAHASAEIEGARRRSAPGRASAVRLPGLSPAASAVALAQARTALRSVRGRTVVLLPGPVLAMLGLLSRRLPGEFPGGDLLGSSGPVLLGAGVLFGLYAMQAFTMNQFASDRSGLTLQLLAPLSDRDLVLGKAVGCGIVLGVSVLVCLASALVVAPGGSPLAWISVLLGGTAAYVMMTPAAALMSALFPVASDLSKTGSGGNPHGLSMLVSTLLVMALAAPPALILALAVYRFDRPGLGLIAMILWLLLAVAVSIPLLRLSSRVVAPRRENLALVAQGR